MCVWNGVERERERERAVNKVNKHILDNNHHAACELQTFKSHTHVVYKLTEIYQKVSVEKELQLTGVTWRKITVQHDH